MRQLQEQIIEDLKVIPTIDPQVEVRRRIDFLKDYLKQTKMATLVLGISGGQDSALAGRLAQLAVEELRKESERRLPVHRRSPALWGTSRRIRRHDGD